MGVLLPLVEVLLLLVLAAASRLQCPFVAVDGCRGGFRLEGGRGRRSLVVPSLARATLWEFPC